MDTENRKEGFTSALLFLEVMENSCYSSVDGVESDQIHIYFDVNQLLQIAFETFLFSQVLLFFDF